MKVYTITWVKPKPSSWLRRLLRRQHEAFRVWPNCLDCGQPVDDLKPLVRQGRDMKEGLVTWKEPDAVVGSELLPCRCRADQVVMIVGQVCRG
jgi:hypothetical protein